VLSRQAYPDAGKNYTSIVTAM